MSPSGDAAEDRAALLAARAHTDALLRDAAEHVEEHPLGFGVRCDATPRAHMLNLLRVTAVDTTVDAITTACDELQDGLGHRKAEVLDHTLGSRLASGFAERGWAMEQLVVMARRRAPDRPHDLRPAEQAHPALFAQTELAVERELMPDAADDLHAELAEARGRLRAAAASRLFVGFRQNAPAAHATLLVRDGVAQVEDVATALWARGHGLASACVLSAVDDARRDGARLTFLHADHDDWPRVLYRRLGFDVVGGLWTFTRT